MNRRRPWILIVLVCLVLMAQSEASPSQAARPFKAVSARSRPASHLARAASASASGVQFIENVGQFADGARFQVRGAVDGLFWLSDDALWFTVVEQEGPDEAWPDPESLGAELPAPDLPQGVNLRLSFVGANPHPRLEPFQRLDTSVNYFLGNDPNRWHTNVPVWAGVRFVDLYPGVDLILGGGGELAGPRLVAKPGADLGVVQFLVEGAQAVMREQGSDTGLHLTTAVGEFRLPLPVVEGKVPEGQPTIVESEVGSFEVSMPFAQATTAADASQAALVDDPAGLFFSTFVGGSELYYDERGIEVVLDGDGNPIVAGYSYAADFPTTPGAYDPSHNGALDIVVFKLSADGSTLLYSTYVGGTTGDWETVHGLALDGDGNFLVTGRTEASDFPTTTGAFDTTHNGKNDGFLFRLSLGGQGTGDLLYSTYLGGIDEDRCEGVAADDEGHAVLACSSRSTDFPSTPGSYDPTYNGGWDAAVLKLDMGGNGSSDLLYGSFVASPTPSHAYSDVAYDLALDTLDRAVVTGSTTSDNFPTTAGAYDTSHNGGSDVFVFKLAMNGMGGSDLVYSTYVGGYDIEEAYALTLSNWDEIVVTGITYSSDFPTKSAYQAHARGYSDLFVFKLIPINMGSDDLVFSTYLGGSDYEYACTGKGLGVHQSGNILITGSTTSLDFPTTEAAYDTSHNGLNDLVVATLSEDGGSLLYSTYIGGDWWDYGHGLALDQEGQAVVTGYTWAPENPGQGIPFPTTGSAYDPTHNGGNDAFVLKLDAIPPPRYSIQGQVLEQDDTPIPGVVLWAGTGISATTSLSGTYEIGDLLEGTYTLTPALDGWLFTPFTRTVSVPPSADGQDFRDAGEPIAGLSATNDGPTPLGQATTLTATVSSGAPVAYEWAFGDGATGAGAVVGHIYTALGSYTAVVTATNRHGSQVATTTVQVEEVPISGLWTTSSSPTPLGLSTTLMAWITAGTSVGYAWDFGDGASGSGSFVGHIYPWMGEYTAVVTASNSVSLVTDTVDITVGPGCVARINGSPATYSSVQSAVDASTHAGDLVQVAGICSGVGMRDGVTQTVYLDKSLTVQGGYSGDFASWNPDTFPTRLDAQGQGRVFYIKGEVSPCLENLQVTNGWYDHGSGGGIYSWGAHPVISDCLIYGNTITGTANNDGFGAAIGIQGGSNVVLQANRLYNNSARLGGGALYTSGAVDGLTITGNEIYDNTSDFFGGAVLLGGTGSVHLQGNTIHGNTAAWKGGGVFASVTGLEMAGNQVYGNQVRGEGFGGGYDAEGGGGVYLSEVVQAVLTGNVIRNNSVIDRDGGGISYPGFLDTNDLALTNNIIADNEIVGSGDGAGLWLQQIESVRAAHNTIARNAGGSGQGVYAYYHTTMWMTNTILVSQTVGVEAETWTAVDMDGTMWGDGTWANGTDTIAFDSSNINIGLVNVYDLPGFVDPDGGDYHLRRESAAIDAGVDSNIALDIDGEARPSGADYDLGADERPVEAIAGLEASSDSPTRQGEVTTFSAVTAAGTKLSYHWAFGDGHGAPGAEVVYVYPASGNYTAIVTATNAANQVTATTSVLVYDVAQVAPGGGLVVTSDGVLGLESPVGLGTTLTFTYTPLVSPSHSAGDLAFEGVSFQLFATDEGGNPVHVFSPPLTLTAHYDQASLQPGIDEATLEIRRWDAPSISWQPLQILARDTAADTIVAVLDHLSEFALFGPSTRRVYLPLVVRGH